MRISDGDMCYENKCNRTVLQRGREGAFGQGKLPVFEMRGEVRREAMGIPRGEVLSKRNISKCKGPEMEDLLT